MTPELFLALADRCAPGVAPGTLLPIAYVESRLNPAAVNINKDGSRDIGLMQINERNFGWLGLTHQTALDPCESIRAASNLLKSYSRYNTGNPEKGFVNGYVNRVISASSAVYQQRKADAAPTINLNAQISTFTIENDKP